MRLLRQLRRKPCIQSPENSARQIPHAPVCNADHAPRQEVRFDYPENTPAARQLDDRAQAHQPEPQSQQLPVTATAITMPPTRRHQLECTSAAEQLDDRARAQHQSPNPAITNSNCQHEAINQTTLFRMHLGRQAA